MNINRKSLSLSDKQIYKARASLHHRMRWAYFPAMSQYFINLAKKEKMFMGYTYYGNFFEKRYEHIYTTKVNQNTTRSKHLLGFLAVI
jgi:hypothetical protein